MTQTTNLPKVIDCDLIRELRQSGRRKEATALLKTFRADVEKSKRQVRNDDQRRTFRIKKIQGICICCKNKAEPGKVKCKSCADRDNKSQTKYQNLKRLVGICIDCGNKALPHKSKCQKCLDKDSNYNYHRYHVRKSKGICLFCDNKAEPGKVKCKLCLQKDRDRKRKKRD